MAHEEIAEIPKSGTKSALEHSVYAVVSSRCWNATDMGLATPKCSNIRLPEAFGNLELISQVPAVDVAKASNRSAEKFAEFRPDYTSREYLDGLERAVDKDRYNKFYKLQKESEYFAYADKSNVIAQVLPAERATAVSLESEKTNPSEPSDLTVADVKTPSSWIFPTKDNFKGWMPGDTINPFTWTDDSSKYIQEIMKQNFVTNADGKRVSIFDLDNHRYKHFKDQFGNAARHALGMGDLIFNNGMLPKNAQNGMYLHEPLGWAGGLARTILAMSWEPFQNEMSDSNADIKNNEYAAKHSRGFHGFESFARQMLTDAWKSAKNCSWIIADGANETH